jgi:CRISPR-associated protein Cmx8
VAGTLLLGVQEANAEDVPFRGTPAENLLLHFWPVVMGVGEAWQVKIDAGQVRQEPVAYVLTVPDVADLDGFLEDFPGYLQGLGTERAGYRPREAVLALRAEGGLQFLRHVTALAQARAGSSALHFSVSGVQVFELVRRGKKVSIGGTDRLPARRELIEQYDIITARSSGLLFRAQLIRNLLAEAPWFSGFQRLFETHPWQLFFGTGTTFPHDAGRRLQRETESASLSEET